MNDVLSSAASAARRFDVQAVAEVLGCSAQHVYLFDVGRMPVRVRLGITSHRPMAAIRKWIHHDGHAICKRKGGANHA